MVGTHDVNLDAQVIKFHLVLLAGLAGVVGDEHDFFLFAMERICVGIEK